MIRYTLIFLLFTGLPGCVRAQDLKVTASVTPAVMRVGDQFNLTYSSDQEISEIQLPEISNVEVLGGPRQGHSRSVYSVNGQITTSSTYQYTYFLRASHEGKFNIPAITVKVKNKPVRTNPVTIEVLAANSQATRQSPGGSVPDPGGSVSKVSEKNLFVALLLDKKEVYIGEPIMAMVKIYTKVNLSGVDPNFKGPDFTGFFTEPINLPQLRNLQSENYNGDIFYTGIIRKIMIIPQKTGPLTVKAFDLDVTIRQEVRHRISDDPFFQDFDFPEVQDIPVKLKSKEVTIMVKPLPGKAPSSYGGAVGNFTFSASLNKNETHTNEPVTLKLTVAGRGNVKLINEPSFDLPPDLEKYDPVINAHTDNPPAGTKTFEYLLMPKAPGSFTIPPVEFTYFDAASQQYKTLQSQALDLKVAKGQGDTLMQVIPGMAREDIRLINQDIRFIKNKPFRLTKEKSFLADSLWYYLLYVFMLGLFIGLAITRRKYVRERADQAGMRLKKADRYARKRLTRSEALLKQGQTGRFYEELLGAIWGYLSDKLNISLSVLSRETAQGALQAKSINNELTEELFRIVSECEAARYGMVSENSGMEKLYRDTIDVITSLQQKLK